MAFIAGPYLATFNTAVTGAEVLQTLGQVEDGFNLDYTSYAEPISGDNLAQAMQEMVLRGLDMFLEFVLLEFNALAAQRIFWPYSATFGTYGQVGRIVGSAIGSNNALANKLVLTAVAGTTAATVPITLTAPLAILAQGFPLRLLYGNRLRRVPLRLQLFPNASYQYFTTT